MLSYQEVRGMGHPRKRTTRPDLVHQNGQTLLVEYLGQIFSHVHQNYPAAYALAGYQW